MEIATYHLTSYNSNNDVDHYTEIENFRKRESIESPWESMTRWNYHNDMIEYSKKYPNTLFELRHFGENIESVGVVYFKNGKYEKFDAEITVKFPLTTLK